jgi:putative Mg2+ transporter-C (MgtC) family protein
MTFPPWDWAQSGERLLSVAVAYVLALPIGWNWEKIRHNSGLRTFPLVAVASCCYVLVARHVVGPNNQNLDRVIQGLMTGIGFIGGGAIFRQGANVRGTATAASIWCVGALGAAVACGAWDIAVMLGVVNLATLRLLRPVKEMIDTERPDPRG